MSSPSPDRPRWRKRLIGWLRLAAGLAILLLVARTLPWSDRLVWNAGVGEEVVSHSLDGEIVGGDWTGTAIRFRVAEGQEVADVWPAAVRAAAAAGEEVAVARTEEPDAALGGGYDWKPSMPRAFREMDPGGLLKALLFFSLGMATVITRWWRLLHVVGCTTTWFNSCRLTFLGMFFNLVVPGLTGGDVIKGLIVAHENPGKRADALVSVGVDRLIGIIALAGMAMVVILLVGAEFAELRLPVLAFLLAGILGALVYVNKTLRSLVRFDALLAKLPLGDKLKSLDDALLTYGRRPGELLFAAAISLLNHVLVAFGFVALGGAFQVTGASVLDYFVIVPVGNMVSALPLAPGGWGLGEAIYKFLFEMVGADGGLGVAVSVTFRLCMLLFGLIGGVFLLLPSQRRELHESEEDTAD